MLKLFIFIIDERIKIFIECNKLLFEEQVGLRDGYGTLDHVITLDFITNKYTSKGNRLYFAFMDYRKAFDSVDKIILWGKN